MLRMPIHGWHLRVAAQNMQEIVKKFAKFGLAVNPFEIRLQCVQYDNEPLGPGDFPVEKYRYLQSCARSGSGSAAILALAFLLAPHQIRAQTSPLSENVLVVYNSADANSTAVANYYISKRGIPAENVCPIQPPSTTLLNWNDFNTFVKNPIRNCLNSSASGNLF